MECSHCGQKLDYKTASRLLEEKYVMCQNTTIGFCAFWLLLGLGSMLLFPYSVWQTRITIASLTLLLVTVIHAAISIEEIRSEQRALKKTG